MSTNAYQIKAGDLVTSTQDVYMVSENLEEGELFTKEQVEKYVVLMCRANQRMTVQSVDASTIMLYPENVEKDGVGQDGLYVSYDELSQLFDLEQGVEQTTKEE